MGLQDVVLANSPSVNATFKRYLQEIGPPTKNLNSKKMYEVLLGSKNFLEAEWQSMDLAKYNQGQFEIKDDFKYIMEKSLDEAPHYNITTVKDANVSKKGTILSFFTSIHHREEIFQFNSTAHISNIFEISNH